jgi:hypothetical protein
MGKYDHSFNDLHTPDTVEGAAVDLTNEAIRQDATGATVISESPRNPNAGKADQFGDIERVDRPDEVTADNDTFVLDTSGNTDDADKGKGDAFEERLGRERILREEAEERSRRLEAQVGQLTQRVDLEDQTRAADAENSKDRTKLEALRARKIKAKEEGDTTAEVDVDDQITDVKASIKSRTDKLETARAAAKQTPAKAAVVNPKAQAWITAHPAYGSDPLFKEAALAADQLLYKMGHNQNSDEYYTRLSKILDERFHDKVNPEYLKSRRGGKSAAGGVGSNGVRGGNSMTVQNSNPNKVVITSDEIKMLQTMGQDTTDPKVLREFARNKQADARNTRSQS